MDMQHYIHWHHHHNRDHREALLLYINVHIASHKCCRFGIVTQLTKNSYKYLSIHTVSVCDLTDSFCAALRYIILPLYCVSIHRVALILLCFPLRLYVVYGYNAVHKCREGMIRTVWEGQTYNFTVITALVK